MMVKTFLYLATSGIPVKSQADLRDVEPTRPPGTMIIPSCRNYEELLPKRDGLCPSITPAGLS